MIYDEIGLLQTIFYHNNHCSFVTFCKFNTLLKGVCMITCPLQKSVHVNAYSRYRYGKWEYVREHCRSLPNRQLKFEF